MGSELKRVGLVFKADGAVEFKKTLGLINGELSKNTASFKLVKAQYDENTKASQKLADKQEFLNTQYTVQQQKVEILKRDLEELANSEEKNSRVVGKKQAQLDNATAAMIKYNKELEAVNFEVKKGTADLEEFTKKLKEKGEKTSAFGNSLTKNVSAPILALGIGAVAAFDEIDKGYDSIISSTGAAGDEIDKLTNSFDNVFANFPFTSEEVSTAIGDLNTRFGFLDEQLETASSDFIKFAKINKTDVKTAIQLVSRAMGDAGIPAEEYSGLLDTLTVASQKSGISISELTDFITKYGAPLRTLGLDTKEAVALFSQWEKAGVNTEIAFAGLKQAIGNWGKSNKNPREEFQKTLKLIEETPDIAEATALAIEIFGQRSGPDLADAIKGGRFAYEDFLKILESSAGTVENTFNAMQDPLDESQVAWNNLKLALAELGNTIQTMVGPILLALSEELKKVTGWFKNLSPEMKELIVKIGLILLAIGPLLIIFGTLAGAISSLVTLFVILKGIFLAITLPIGLVIIAIVSLIAIIMTLIKHWDTIREVASACWDSIKNVWRAASFWFDENIGRPILNIFENLTKTIKNVFSIAWHGIQVGAISMANGVVTVINDMVSTALRPLNTLIDGLNAIPGVDIKKLSFSIGKMPIPKLAKGGTLLNGMAMIAEAGPELLLQQGNRTKVLPLSSNSSTKSAEIVDYEKLSKSFLKALNSCKLKLDEDGFVQFIDERLMEVV